MKPMIRSELMEFLAGCNMNEVSVRVASEQAIMFYLKRDDLHELVRQYKR